MQFTELRNLSREIIREAFGFPKALTGSVDDVNRANAEANEVMFARWLLVPRLERIKQALNNDFLPLFGTAAKGLEFDYDNPVPDDRELASAELTARANAAKALADAGWEPAGVLSAVGLPEISYGAPAAVPEPAPSGRPARAFLGRSRTRGTADHPEPPDMAAAMAAVQASHDKALNALIAEWGPIQDAQTNALVGQVEQLVDAGDVDQLAAITAPTEQAQEALTASLKDVGGEAARQVTAEAAAQGAEVQPVPPPEDDLAAFAAVAVGLLAVGLAAAAAASAIRRAAPGASGRDVGQGVRADLGDLTDAALRDQLGAAVHRAQHAGRMATMRLAPTFAFYGSELNDANTCTYCREVDGRFLGDTLAQAEAEYPTGGYIRCEGRQRCRGHVVAVYRPKQTEES
jgi:hypothetical protein